MTDRDYAEIQARHEAADSPERTRLPWNNFEAQRAHEDRGALLADVRRLREEADNEPPWAEIHDESLRAIEALEGDVASLRAQLRQAEEGKREAESLLDSARRRYDDELGQRKWLGVEPPTGNVVMLGEAQYAALTQQRDALGQEVGRLRLLVGELMERHDVYEVLALGEIVGGMGLDAVQKEILTRTALAPRAADALRGPA